MRTLSAIIIAVAAMLASQRAHAYPQFQLSQDQACANCHLSPAGGGLLSENGYNVADVISMFGTAPEFMYDKLPLPSWLVLGGDLRAATGYVRAPDDGFALFPMQGEIYARGMYKGLSLHLTAGVRPAQWIPGNGDPAIIDRFWSREHYVTWQQNELGGHGLFIRAGRFMPVFGLRFAEHPNFNRQYGGTPLFGDTYGAAVEYVTQEWEAHVTGFIEDPLIDPPTRDNGAAAYVEKRLNQRLAVGGELMVTEFDGNYKFRGGATGKMYFEGPELLLQGELQFVHQQVTGGDGAPNQLIAYLMASKPLGKGLLLDLGLSHYNENIAIQGLDRDAIDINLHWFVTSHLEIVLHNRLQAIGLVSDNGGPTSGWSLLHAHYRL